MSEQGERCESREFLELDHVIPVPKGGQSTVANVRLRCHAHNQYEAERQFGAGFREREREEARRRTEAKCTAARALAAERLRRERRARELAADTAARERAFAAMPWLRDVVEAGGTVRAPAGHPQERRP